MKITAANYLGLVSLFVALAALAVLFDTGVFATSILLSIIPVAYLWLQLRPPTSLLSVIAVFAVGTTLLFEAIAASNGLWYSVPGNSWQLFGSVPAALFFSNFVFNVFVVVLYEYFVDDRSLHEPRANKHFRWLVFFAGATTLIGLVASVSLSGTVSSYAFATLLMLVVGTLGAVLWLSHSASRQLLLKAAKAAGLIFPFFVIHEIVALFNVHIVYANPTQYLYSITLLGNDWPLEKLFFFIIIPIWLVVVYEVYLDDAQ